MQTAGWGPGDPCSTLLVSVRPGVKGEPERAVVTQLHLCVVWSAVVQSALVESAAGVFVCIQVSVRSAAAVTHSALSPLTHVKV